jgi:predicted nucleic acid-binding Zn ribbon protein
MTAAKPRYCPRCDKPVKGHPNKKFCSSTCKDQHHNQVNPRGRYAHLKRTRAEIEALDKEAMHNEAMAAQEAGESPGGFFGDG